MAAYISVDDADTYFETRLAADNWTDADDDIKLSALTMATQNIDRLNFMGFKSDPDQTNKFPRIYSADDDPETDVPEEIIVACCEEALALLNGKEVERDLEAININHVTMGRTSYGKDVSFIPEHLTSGIASALAWQYLKPFLRDPRSVVMQRIN